MFEGVKLLLKVVHGGVISYTAVAVASIMYTTEQSLTNNVSKLEQHMAEVATSIPTGLFGSKYGHLALARRKCHASRASTDLGRKYP